MSQNYYATTDQAITAEFGRRIEQIRLESNLSQEFIAKSVGISETTYRQAIKGKAKFEVIIGILRALNRLDNLEKFLPETPYSPIARMKMEGKKRKRASSGVASEPVLSTTPDITDDETW
ncbi:MAG: helix-turn-helix transcriptional regulator [Motiliproteus sp.]